MESVGVLQRTSEILVQSPVNSSQVQSDLTTRYGSRVVLGAGTLTNASAEPVRKAVAGFKIKYRHGPGETDTDPEVVANGCTLGHNTYIRYEGRITNFALTAAHCKDTAPAPERPIQWVFASGGRAADIGREVSEDRKLTSP